MATQKQRKAAKKRKQKAIVKRIKQPEDALIEQLKRQIRFICKFSKAFDNGDVDASISIALCIRVLIHDSQAGSPSLLCQLGKKGCLFYDSMTPKIHGAAGPYHGLVVMELSLNPRWGWMPLLYVDEDSVKEKRLFEDWWDTVVLDDEHGNIFTRKDIILTVCNKDGGAHVDPELEEKYVKLEKSKEFAYIFSVNGNVIKPRVGAGFASVRQIGFELMMTLSDEFPALLRGKYLRPHKKPDTNIIGGFQLVPISDPDNCPLE